MRRRILCTALAISFSIGCISAAAAESKDEIFVPDEVSAVSEEIGERYNICPELIQAVCWTESRFDADAENGGCIGIMQIYGRWHRDRMERLGVTDLHDMKGNMAVGADYLAELFAKYGDAAYVLMVYNGTSNAKELYGKGQLTEYAEKVLRISADLERKNGK